MALGWNEIKDRAIAFSNERTNIQNKEGNSKLF
jgi:hypothetical protein